MADAVSVPSVRPSTESQAQAENLVAAVGLISVTSFNDAQYDESNDYGTESDGTVETESEDVYYYEDDSTVIDELVDADGNVDVIEITEISTPPSQGKVSSSRNDAFQQKRNGNSESSQLLENPEQVTVVYYYEEVIETMDNQPFMFQLSYATISLGVLAVLTVSLLFAKMFEGAEDDEYGTDSYDYKDLEKQVIHHQHKQLEALMKLLHLNSGSAITDEKLPAYHSTKA